MASGLECSRRRLVWLAGRISVVQLLPVQTCKSHQRAGLLPDEFQRMDVEEFSVAAYNSGLSGGMESSHGTGGTSAGTQCPKAGGDVRRQPLVDTVEVR